MALPIAMPQLPTVLVPATTSVSLLGVMLPQCVHPHLTVLIHLLELNALVLNCNQVAVSILNANINLLLRCSKYLNNFFK